MSMVCLGAGTRTFRVQHSEKYSQYTQTYIKDRQVLKMRFFNACCALMHVVL